MGNEDVIAAEFLKGADGLVGAVGASATMASLMPVRSTTFCGMGLPGLTKVQKLLFLVDLAVFDIDGADFGQAFDVGVEARGLGVKHDEGAGGSFGIAVDCGDHVVHEVSLTAVDQLEVGVVSWMASVASMASG